MITIHKQALQNSTMPHIKNAISRFLQEKKFCDIKIVLSDGCLIEARRVVIVRGSDFFSAMLEYSEPSEELKFPINFPWRHDPRIVRRFLRLVFELKSTEKTTDAKTFYLLADFFGMTSLLHEMHPKIVVKHSNVDNGIVSVGGWTQDSPSIKMELYDFKKKSWMTLAQTLPNARAYHGCVTLDDKLYVIGGYDGQTYHRSAWYLDLKTLQWHNLPPMHFRRCYVSIAVLDNAIYVMGGFDGENANQRLSACEKLEPSTNQWTMIRPMTKKRSDASAICYEDKVFIVGGFNGENYINTVECYDPVQDHWNVLPYKMKSHRGGLGCAILKGILYAIGGNNGKARLETVECLDLKDMKKGWHPAPSMHTRRSNFGICNHDNKYIFVAGGYHSPTTTNESEWFDGKRWHKSRIMIRSASALTLTEIPKALQNWI